MNEKEYTVLTGSVSDVTYKSEESGFAVLEVDVGNELVCAVGPLFSLEVGEEVKLTGYYQTHPTFGQQFRVEMFERSLPENSGAICKYLSSGVVKGIGPALAKRIVQKFGDDTLKVIEETPQRLAEVSGISLKKAGQLNEEFKQVFGIRVLMLFLSQHGFTAIQSVKIFKKWGANALELIKENPYILCTSELGVTFQQSDGIADSLSMPKESPERIYAALYFVLSHNLLNGHTGLPREKLLSAAGKLLELSFDLVENGLDDALADGRFCSIKVPDLIFLPEYYQAQRIISERLHRMLDVLSKEPADVDHLIDEAEKEKGIHYETLQREAIKQASYNDAFILTGGPGTGKTTTLNGILSVLTRQGKSVVLAAPTGRAAKRMSEVTQKEAKTIHRLLEVSAGYQKTGKLEFIHNEENPLDADVVIIDEMSMVDTMLFYSLLLGMKTTAKLIMVGDFHQLPSVGAGNVLRDLIESDVIPMVELTQVFRQAAKSLIVTNAHRIVNGEMPDLKVRNNDFFFLPERDFAKAAQTVSDLCCTRLPKAYGYSPFDDIQVLCPSRRGELGTGELNGRLQQRLNPKEAGKTEFKFGGVTFRVGDKVMQIRNNYDITWTKDSEEGTGIFNGDIGVIRMVDRGSSTMAIEFDGRLAYYAFDMASELELAYAITVHKSQGNEFEAVILPVMGGFSKLYYRNLLYTAVTRAKKLLILVGEQSRVEFMVRNDKKMLRYTGLKEMLQQSVLKG